MSFSKFYHKIMKKLYVRTNIGSSGRDCVFIIYFYFMALKSLGFLKVIYFGWVSMTPQPSYWKKN